MSAESLTSLTDPLRTNFWTVIHLGSRHADELKVARLYFAREASALPHLRKGEAIALSYEFWNAEAFHLRLPDSLRAQP